jgi:hypothetical protein
VAILSGVAQKHVKEIFHIRILYFLHLMDLALIHVLRRVTAQGVSYNDTEYINIHRLYIYIYKYIYCIKGKVYDFKHKVVPVLNSLSTTSMS